MSDRYYQSKRRCRFCERPLRDKDSRKRGYGPECARRDWVRNILEREAAVAEGQMEFAFPARGEGQGGDDFAATGL